MISTQPGSDTAQKGAKPMKLKIKIIRQIVHVTNLLDVMRQSGRTQRAWAALLGVSEQYLSDVAHGRRGMTVDSDFHHRLVVAARTRGGNLPASNSVKNITRRLNEEI